MKRKNNFQHTCEHITISLSKQQTFHKNYCKNIEKVPGHFKTCGLLDNTVSSSTGQGLPASSRLVSSLPPFAGAKAN